jgi:hypothetical protein
LEDEHAGRPDAWAAAEPWQDVLGHDRLYLEKQKCTDKDRSRKQEERESF